MFKVVDELLCLSDRVPTLIAALCQDPSVHLVAPVQINIKLNWCDVVSSCFEEL